MAEDTQQDPFEDPSKDPRIIELALRIANAEAALEKLNEVRRPEDPRYAVDESIALVARVDALASILISHGIIDYVEFTGEHMVREAETLEQAVAAFAEDKRRRMTGLTLPPSAQNGRTG